MEEADQRRVSVGIAAIAERDDKSEKSPKFEGKGAKDLQTIQSF